MTRLFLAAGVAALAIATPAAAKPGGGGGGGNPHGDNGGNHGGGGGGNPHGGGGGGGAAPAFNPGGGGGHGHGSGGGGQPAFSFGGGGGGHGHGGGGFAAPQRVDRQQFQAPQMRVERQQARAFGGGGHGHGGGQQQARAFDGGGHGHGGGNQQARTFVQQGGGHGHGGGKQQARAFAQQGGGGGHGHDQQVRTFANNGGGGHGRGQQVNGFAQQQVRGFERQQAQVAQGEQLRGPGMKGLRALAGPQFNGAITGQELAGGRTAQFANQEFIQQNARPYAMLSYGNNGQVLPVTQVAQFVGQPISVVPSYVALSPLPSTLQYLYPSTPDYYYQYGGGYLYQVDRTDNLIAALIPLLGGGFLPGQYLPQSYMTSYAPDYYGYDAFYPADYGYGDLCNRYEYGVIYQVDCYDGMVENVIPVYAGGYGVGQLLPTAYRTYNVPTQYRSMYYNTADAGYWYAPGAIYQYDPRSSVITSVATLMSPGFSVGQPLPIGYGAYNVPYDYRATYYDTPTAWYRYNNGYIYQVDPTTQLVTAIVASLLT